MKTPEYPQRAAVMRPEMISGSFCVSITAAMGMPKLLRGRQLSGLAFLSTAKRSDRVGVSFWFMRTSQVPRNASSRSNPIPVAHISYLSSNQLHPDSLLPVSSARTRDCMFAYRIRPDLRIESLDRRRHNSLVRRRRSGFAWCVVCSQKEHKLEGEVGLL